MGMLLVMVLGVRSVLFELNATKYTQLYRPNMLLVMVLGAEILNVSGLVHLFLVMVLGAEILKSHLPSTTYGTFLYYFVEALERVLLRMSSLRAGIPARPRSPLPQFSLV